ncbi:Leucine Rich repeat [Novymonas esmeraldas]|uniref:Leucine Rich repeat n=1 Tax=Novymonas esmeraldas TaxID=1808958 RepID=A0AAW0EIK3_9TRYP
MTAVATMAALPQQPPTPAAAAAAASPYITPEPKEKGDAGIYAALSAMQLARALHGVTGSRLGEEQQQQQAAEMRGAPAAATNTTGGDDNGATHSNVIRLGVEPVDCRKGTAVEVQAMYNAAVVEAVRDVSHDAATVAAVERGVGGAAGTTTAVGLPDDPATLRSVMPLVHELKPQTPVSFDALQRLFAIMEEAAVGAAGGSGGVTSLLLANGAVDPARQPAPSTAAWEAKYHEVHARYPLPTAKAAGSSAGSRNSGEDNDEDDDDDTPSEVDRQNNAELQERCATLNIPYETHANAVRDVAFHEMRVFQLLCAYLSTVNRRTSGGRDAATVAAVACSLVRVLDLSYNYLGAPVVVASAGDGGDGGDGAPVRQLAPLRALAAMLDANESLRYVNLRANALGLRGVGIVAKALTKNIALCGIDLSANALHVAADTEEVEDPLYEPEDAVFGEPYEGLEALSEVLKKNKFLRVLRLAENGLHAGEDLTGPPPAEEEEDAGEGDEEEEGVAEGGDVTAAAGRRGLSFAAAQERWQSAPLWMLLSPLYRYHRLRALDLSKNSLGNDGVHMLAVALSHNASLEVLDLTDNAIGYAGLGHLARYVLRRLTAATAAATAANGTGSPAAAPPCALHTLILRQNPLACVGGAADAAAGVDARRRRLSKRQQRRAAAAVQSFASALEGPRGLRRLVLANTYLGPAFSAVVLRSLARAEALEELDFSFNHACGDHPTNFNGAAALELAAVMYRPHQATSRPPSLLQRVCFDGNNLTAAGVAALLPTEAHVAFPPALHELTLSRNGLGDDLGSLSQLLAAGAATLTHVDVSYNGINTAAALLPGLAAATALAELNLSHNRLGVQEGHLHDITAAEHETAVAQLFQCLAHLPSLAVLDLSHNDWRVGHVEQLSAFFSNTALATALRKLDVRHTPRVPAAQLMTLLQYVASRPTMEVFMATVVPDKSGAAPQAHDDDGAREEVGGGAVEAAWTFDAVLQVIHGVVANSGSLLEVDSGLLRSDAGGEGGDVSATTTAALNEVRERLLLNALMKAAVATPSL